MAPRAPSDIGRIGRLGPSGNCCGRFEAGAIAPGQYWLEVDGSTSPSGVYGATFREITVEAGMQTLPPVVLMPSASRAAVDVDQGGVITFAQVPGAALDIAPQSAHFPTGEPATIGLTLLPVAALARPLPSGFDGVVAAQLVPPGLSFTAPARLSLPNAGQIEAGQLLVLMCLDADTGAYEPLGLGRVRSRWHGDRDLSGGLTACSTVVFASTASDALRVFLLPVSGNNQQTQPGEALPEPLVVRLEDQFGNPIIGEPLTAVILQGEGEFIQSEVFTNHQGEAHFRVIAGASEEDLAVQISVPAVSGVRPVQFFSVVGAIDTPGSPRGLAVAEDVAYVGVRRSGLQVNDSGPQVIDSGLQVIDVSTPTQPTTLHTLSLKTDASCCPQAVSVFLDGSLAYIGASGPQRLFIVDITHPRDPDFATDTDGDGAADVVLAIQEFPDDASGGVKNIAVRDHLLYAISLTFTTTPAQFYVFDMHEPTQPRLLSTTPLPTGNPHGLDVSGDFAYVAADSAGLLVFDVRDPTMPTLVSTLRDPDPLDDADIVFTSDVTVVGDVAYVVETQRRHAGEPEDHFTVIDIRTPSAPKRRGTVQLITKPQVTIIDPGLAIEMPFAYVSRGFFGLEALDIRDPDAPRQVGFVQTPSRALDVTTAHDKIYVTDEIFGLLVIQGPETAASDTDGDGIVDFFDAFPTDPQETRDTDGDRMGNNTDDDDDDDSFSDGEEQSAIPPSNPLDPLSVPIRIPPSGVTAVIVAASTPLPARERIGTPEAPYRSITEALQALRSDLVPEVETLRIRSGTYSPYTTQEVIPIDLGHLSHLTVEAETPGRVVVDGAFRGDVVKAEFSHHLVVDGLVVTHGANGMTVRESSHVTLRNNQSRNHTLDGIRIGLNANTGIVVTNNLIEFNGQFGLQVVANAAATVTRNILRSNILSGILIVASSTADIIDNIVTHHANDAAGIVIWDECTATITGNIVEQKVSLGLLIVSGATAKVIQNTLRMNGDAGVAVDNATVELRDNTVVSNGGDRDHEGVAVLNGAVVKISGGVISQNSACGIFIGPSPFGASPATATIGFDSGAVIEISNNGGAGIFVEDNGSKATIDSRHIIFSNNAKGDIVGNVIDVAP